MTFFNYNPEKCGFNAFYLIFNFQANKNETQNYDLIARNNEEIDIGNLVCSLILHRGPRNRPQSRNTGFFWSLQFF